MMGEQLDLFGNEVKEMLETFFNGAKPIWQVVTDFEVVGHDKQGIAIEEEVYYWVLNLDFGSCKEKGVEFIDNFTIQKVEKIGLKLYDKDFSESFLKGMYKSMLDTMGVIQIKLEMR